MRINPKYRPLWVDDYRIAVLSGGRGSGKSFAVQTFLRDLTYEAGHKIISTRYTMTSAEKSVVPEFGAKLELDASPYGGGVMGVDFELNGRTFTNKRSQSEISFMGLKTSSGIQTASLKSIEGLTTWQLDEAEELPLIKDEVEEHVFEKINNSIRKKGIKLRTILSWNPSNEESFVYSRFFKDPGIPIDFNGVHDGVLYVYTNYLDNVANLSQDFIDAANRKKIINQAAYEHIFLGYPIRENAHALWKRLTMISPFRVSWDQVPEMRRILVGVDPSVTSTGRQDECGVVTAGEGIDGHYYLLRDDSGMMSPSEWAKTVAGVVKEVGADCVIAEVNQGGDLVEMNIKNFAPQLRVKKVNATRGKIKRAEPIAALYEEGRVHHVGEFKDLEAEMCSYTGDPKDDSPNRLDALVWVLTGLVVGYSDDLEISFV